MPRFHFKPGRRSRALALMMSAILFAGYVLWIYVPGRFLTVGPGPAPDAASLVVPVAGAEGSDRSEGRFLVTTIVATPATPDELLRAWLDPLVELWPRSALVPRGMDDEAYEEWGLASMAESQSVAAAEAWSFLGQSVAVVSDGLEVLFVDAAGPGAGLLEVKDVVVAWRLGDISEPAYLPERFEERVVTAFWSSRASAQRVWLELTVERGGRGDRAETVLLPLADGELTRWPFLGLALGSVCPRTEPQVPVSFLPGDIGGPSAGLMMALQIINYFSPTDLTGGKVVAGSGTIGPGGVVGRVGGIDKKLDSAAREGAGVFLAPERDYGEAVAAAAAQERGDVVIIPVGTLEEAYQAVLSLTGQNVAGYNNADLPPETAEWTVGMAAGR